MRRRVIVVLLLLIIVLGLLAAAGHFLLGWWQPSHRVITETCTDYTDQKRTGDARRKSCARPQPWMRSTARYTTTRPSLSNKTIDDTLVEKTMAHQASGKALQRLSEIPRRAATRTSRAAR